jgi:VIT1/CCC1 family predicted Fe2+/Mn2+ transporter
LAAADGYAAGRRFRGRLHRVDLHGAVGWTSALSERDYYLAEQARESAEIDATPEAERQEIRDIYATKGFAGDLLERVVDTITANRWWRSALAPPRSAS